LSLRSKPLGIVFPTMNSKAPVTAGWRRVDGRSPGFWLSLSLGPNQNGNLTCSKKCTVTSSKASTFVDKISMAEERYKLLGRYGYQEQISKDPGQESFAVQDLDGLQWRNIERQACRESARSEGEPVRDPGLAARAS
jgi:hypothetical protein